MQKPATIEEAWARKYPVQGGIDAHERCGKTHQSDSARPGEDKDTKRAPTSLPGAKVPIPIFADAVANSEYRLVEITEVLANHVDSDAPRPRLTNLGKGAQLGEARGQSIAAKPTIAPWREGLSRSGLISSLTLLFFSLFILGNPSGLMIIGSIPLLLPLIFGKNYQRLIALIFLILIAIGIFFLTRQDAEFHARARKAIESRQQEPAHNMESNSP